MSTPENASQSRTLRDLEEAIEDLKISASVTVRVPLALYLRVREFAAVRGISISDVVRLALADYVMPEGERHE